MPSDTCTLLATLTFLPAEKGGRRTTATTERYQPRIKIGNYLSSCVIDSLTGQVEKLDPGTPHDVLIRLPMWKQMEDFTGKSVETYFPIGGRAQIFEVDDLRPVADGVILEVIRTSA